MMEDISLNGNALRQISVRTSGSLKPNLSGRSSARNSPSFRRSNSIRTPRRESKGVVSKLQRIRNNRVVLWLILIALWAYLGFYVQSKWSLNDHRKAEFLGYKSEVLSSRIQEDAPRNVTPPGRNSTGSSGEEYVVLDGTNDLNLKKFDVMLAAKEREIHADQSAPKKRGKSSKKGPAKTKNGTAHGKMEDELIPRRNTTYGLIVGPFGKVEDSVLGWNVDKRRGTCNRKGDFARIVWSRSFVLIFHELSMTGAPISMMELATEILSCGGTVSAVVLSKKGGLRADLDKRGIQVLKDRAVLSFKAAMKADLVIAGSAVCSSWIGQYLSHFPAASSQILWWIMENRREYFDRSKHLLGQVKMLAFLSDSQSKQWLSWCEEEQILLNSPPMLVPLSVNDELAFVAGIPCSLNTPAFTAEKMLEKRHLLRNAVRKEMGLDDNDVLIMSLSSINAAKGQHLLLESALLVVENNISSRDFSSDIFLGAKMKNNQSSEEENDVHRSNSKRKRKGLRLVDPVFLHNRSSMTDDDHEKLRKLLTEKDGVGVQNLKVLIGSVGSKSNKVPYVKTILGFLSQHPNLSNMVLWTPATTRVASLYSAADIYVINAQGFGETFGRVTIEAMAFDLPVLGTDAGGTREIVENNVTGILHPVGHEGTRALAENMLFLLGNPYVRKRMGERGRRLVQDKYLKSHTYMSLAKVLIKCMEIK